MIKELKLPEISEDAESGTVTEILVSKGDKIDEEQPIIAVESDKATVEVPSEVAGTVKDIMVAEGDEVKTGTVLISIETENGKEEEESEEKNQQEDSKEQTTETESKEQEEKNEEESADEEEQTEKEDKTKEVRSREDKEDDVNEEKSHSGDIAAAPLAKRLASELDIDLKSLQKELDEERITSKDVMDYVRSLLESGGSASKSSQGESIPDLPDFSRWGETERTSLSNIRKITAENTSQSWKNIPHVTHFEKVDVTALESFREKLKNDKDIKVSITAFVVKVLGEALIRFPKFNASLDFRKKELVYKKYYHISMATDTPKGLLMPVIRDVNEKGVSVIQEELKEYVKKASEGKISKQDMEGGNIAISNLGTIGGSNFTPVIFPPQVAILGMSSIQTQPYYVDGHEFIPATILPLSLSYDHRVIDGADAARFMNFLKESLEHPMNMLM